MDICEVGSKAEKRLVDLNKRHDNYVIEQMGIARKLSNPRLTKEKEQRLRAREQDISNRLVPQTISKIDDVSLSV